jgi:hypothetical protein
MKAMLDIGGALLADHGCKVQLLPIPAPGEKPSGWDCKDAIADEGWTGEDVLAFFGRAQPLPVVDAPATRLLRLTPLRQRVAVVASRQKTMTPLARAALMMTILTTIWSRSAAIWCRAGCRTTTTARSALECLAQVCDSLPGAPAGHQGCAGL